MPQTRLQTVDLLRSLAILLVLLNHVNMRLVINHIPYTQGLPSYLTAPFVWNGQRGVQIFFAVSGFLITSTSLRRWGTLDRTNVPAFYLFRFARIAPLLGLLLVTLSVLHSAQVPDFIINSKTGGLPAALTAALTFRINVLEATRGYLPGNWDILWSLSVEETFYFFFPLICRFTARSKSLFIAILFLFVILGPIGRNTLAGHNEVWQEYSYLGGMDAIALGCLTALFTHGHKLRPALVRTISIAGAALLVISLAARLDMTLVALGTCLLIAASSQFNPPIPNLLLKPGQLSYEIYLTHMFLVFACFHLFLNSGASLRLVPVLFAVVILLSVILGQIIAKLYSEPLNHRIRRSSEAIRQNRDAVLASDHEGGVQARSW